MTRGSRSCRASTGRGTRIWTTSSTSARRWRCSTRSSSTSKGYEGLPDLAAVKAFVLGAQVTAGAYQRNYPGTVKETGKALRVNEAFQRVLDDPAAGEALQHQALKPLLEEAVD